MSFEILHHDSEGEIPPGVTCTMISRPQACAFIVRTGETFYLGSFAIVDLMIGCRSQRSTHDLTIPCPSRLDLDFLTRHFLLSPILSSMDFRLDVINIGLVASRFRAEWLCEAVPPMPLIAAPSEAERARIIREMQSRAPADRVGNLGELMSGASGLHRVPGRSGRPGLETRPPPGWGWDPGDPDGEG